MAPISELDSFLWKFRYLAYIGHKASLNLCTENGRVKASLEDDLGDLNLMSPFSNQSSPQHPKQRRRNSSYYRRQQRRRNSRISQTGSAEEAVVNAADSTSPDQITENPKNFNENIDAKTVEVSATTSHSADPSHIVTLDSSTSSSPLMASDTSDEFSKSGLEFGFGISNILKAFLVRSTPCYHLQPLTPNLLTFCYQYQTLINLSLQTILSAIMLLNCSTKK